MTTTASTATVGTSLIPVDLAALSVADITDWLETFAQPFLGAVPAPERAAFLQEVRAAVRPALFDAARGWSADYMRLRFDARKMH
jgi:hypothetical protein